MLVAVTMKMKQPTSEFSFEVQHQTPNKRLERIPQEVTRFACAKPAPSCATAQPKR